MKNLSKINLDELCENLVLGSCVAKTQQPDAEGLILRFFSSQSHSSNKRLDSLTKVTILNTIFGSEKCALFIETSFSPKFKIPNSRNLIRRKFLNFFRNFFSKFFEYFDIF